MTMNSPLHDTHLTEKYECLECLHIYMGNPGMQDDCKKCGSRYIKWLNWEKDWHCNEQTNWEWKRK